MKEKVLAHMASVMGGVIHNLNTPLMWIMGRSQLLQTRNSNFENLMTMTEDEVLKAKEKNSKDIDSIALGADKIDRILKALSYKVQLATEGYTAIEIREYLNNEMEYMLADMRFKHETKFSMNLDESRSFYTRLDYNALSWAVVYIISVMIDMTGKGRTITVGFSGDAISITCPEMVFSADIKASIERECASLKAYATVSVCDASGMTARLVLKGE
jgi:hypothetical protein